MFFGCCDASQPAASVIEATDGDFAEVDSLPNPDTSASPVITDTTVEKIVVVENLPHPGVSAIPTSAEISQAEAAEKNRETIHDTAVEDPPPFKDAALPLDCAGQVREALVHKLLRPLATSIKGWPMSELALHVMKVKKALASSSHESRKTVSSWLFGVTKKPDTHRKLSINLHDNQMDLSVEKLTLTDEQSAGIAEAERNSMRQEVLDKGFVFGPGAEFHRWMMGNMRGLPEKPVDTTDVKMHIMLIGNPHWFDSILNFFGHVFAVAHLEKSPQAGFKITTALRDLLPETNRVLDDLLVSEETQYLTVEEADKPSVLRHQIKTRWNLEGIEKRFGKAPRDLFRDRPMYTLLVEDPDMSPSSKRVALKLVESHGHAVEITFFTAQCGNLAWMTSEGKPIIENQQPTLVPGRKESQIFHLRVIDARMPLTGCGCFVKAVDLPHMIFSFDINHDPYCMLSVRCLEMGAFPLEWFWAPLFSGMQMRLLLMRFFNFQLHFKEDEIHSHVGFQVPRLSSVLKRVLKVFSNMVIGVIFSPPEEDPVPVLLQAFGLDCAALERVET